MYILAIETTGPFGSVALVTEEGFLAEKTSKDEMNHLKDLLPMTAQLLSEAGVKKSQLSYIAASIGPGSFTGIRIGVSTARGLGQALDIPVIGVPTLEGFSYKTGVEAVTESQKTRPVICGILNARRGQVYGIVEGFLKGGPYMLTEVLDVLKKQVKPTKRPILFLGDGIDAYEMKIVELMEQAQMTLGKEFYFAPKEVRYQNAGAVGRLALEMIEKGQILSYNDLHPDYMRKAEAEQKLEAGQLPICKLPKQE